MTVSAAASPTAGLPRTPRHIAWLRRAIRATCTGSTAPSPLKRALHWLAFAPFFGIFLMLARLRSRLGHPYRVTGLTPDGTPIPCRLPDLVQMYIYVFNVWEPDLTRYLERLLGPDDTFVDVGANVGYYSLLSAPRARRVVAIEASPSMYDMLEANVDRSGHDNIRCVPKAVAADSGIVTIHRGPARNVGLSTTVARRGFPAEVEVEARPLHELLTPEELATARVVKIDIEGGEDVILRHLDPFLDACPEDVHLLVEVSPLWWADRTQDPDAVLEALFARGFHAYEIENNYWPWRYVWAEAVARPRRWRGPLPPDIKRVDLIFCRREADVL